MTPPYGRAVTPPPPTLDGATVRYVADVAALHPTGNTRHVVTGERVERFAALAICRYDDPGEGVYLFYCDDAWNVVTDTLHESVAAAEEQARFELGEVAFPPMRAGSAADGG